MSCDVVVGEVWLVPLLLADAPPDKGVGVDGVTFDTKVRPCPCRLAVGALIVDD